MKKQLVEETIGVINNARLFMILVRHREIKMISDWIISAEVNVI